MKEHLAQIVRGASNPIEGRNLVREYLQARILGALQAAGAMIPLAFHGGTALRFLFAIARYSEDLDFALEGTRSLYDLRRYLDTVRSTLMAESYIVDLKVSDQKTVQSAFVRFRGLLFELALSPHPEEVLAVKLEVDTNPPAGAGLATTVVRRHHLLQIHHHDRPSLLAGKLHAILQRPFVKGRDMYDLLWYLSQRDWPPPNLLMLNNALLQTGWDGPIVTDANWRGLVRQRLAGVRWEQVIADVRPFLEPGADPSILTRENLDRVLD